MMLARSLERLFFTRMDVRVFAYTNVRIEPHTKYTESDLVHAHAHTKSHSKCCLLCTVVRGTNEQSKLPAKLTS